MGAEQTVFGDRDHEAEIASVGGVERARREIALLQVFSRDLARLGQRACEPACGSNLTL